jgi:PAS domain-containing protein
VCAVESTGVPASTGTTDAAPAAIALLDATARIERATASFLSLYGDERSLMSVRGEIARVATGELETANVNMPDGTEAEVGPAMNPAGDRFALLTVWRDEHDGASAQAQNALFEEPIDDSPAIVWLKDLEGRYLRVNRRYAEQMRTTDEEVRGHTDAELSPSASIEAPRLQTQPPGQKEPLELEYTVAAFEQRPAFAVLRFALRDADGQPTAVCSVAAPSAEAQVARSECERLMRVERWRRLGILAIRDELLDDWGFEFAVSPGDGSGELPPLDSVVPAAEASAAIAAERDAALADAARLADELAAEREQLAAQRLQLAAEREQLADARSGADATRIELEDVRAQLHESQAELEQARTALDARGSEDGPHWNAGTQRALSGALAGITEWRAALKQVVKSLGRDGGWDTAVAWCPEDRRGFMKCVAMWTDGSPNLSNFETRTWQHRQDVGGTEFGRARNRSGATCLLELQTAEDSLLRSAAGEGMRSAVLVPIQNGTETIGMLELLSRSDAPPDGELTLFLEGIGMQLAALAQMLNFAAVPRWTTGRL